MFSDRAKSSAVKERRSVQDSHGRIPAASHPSQDLEGAGQPLLKLLVADPLPPPACYRYRTAALVGPWRRRAEEARADAIKARQARRDEVEGFHWMVEGTIERGRPQPTE